MKKVIAACIDRLFEFDTREELEQYIEALRSRKKKFYVATRGECGEKFRLRVQEQYNSSPMFGDQ